MSWEYHWDARQQEEIRELRLNAEWDAETLQQVKGALEATQRRVNRLELLLHGLLMYLENQGSIDRGTLDVIMRQLDRADGREDGKIDAPEEL